MHGHRSLVHHSLTTGSLIEVVLDSTCSDDDIDSAIRGLKAKYHAGPVVLIGHSAVGPFRLT